MVYVNSFFLAVVLLCVREADSYTSPCGVFDTRAHRISNALSLLTTLAICFVQRYPSLTLMPAPCVCFWIFCKAVRDVDHNNCLIGYHINVSLYLECIGYQVIRTHPPCSRIVSQDLYVVCIEQGRSSYQ